MKKTLIAGLIAALLTLPLAWWGSPSHNVFAQGRGGPGFFISAATPPCSDVSSPASVLSVCWDAPHSSLKVWTGTVWSTGTPQWLMANTGGSNLVTGDFMSVIGTAAPNATEANVQQMAAGTPTAGTTTIYAMVCFVTNAPEPGGGPAGWKFTLDISTAATTWTCTIAGTATSCTATAPGTPVVTATGNLLDTGITEVLDGATHPVASGASGCSYVH